ncbi:Rho1 GTPase [Zopfochytrium polystomum]|nr:Rho1 GTPase [Zopfochytrium polystomum]
MLGTPDTKDIRRKLVIVGDGACGKTCLLFVFTSQKFPEKYVPTVFETYVADVHLDGKRVELALWDTAGQEDYDRLRPLSYNDSNVILICFSIDSLDSLENVSEKWYVEVVHYCPGRPVLLVGCKKDLRSDPRVNEDLRRIGQAPVSFQQVCTRKSPLPKTFCVETYYFAFSPCLAHRAKQWQRGSARTSTSNAARKRARE